MAQWPHNCLLQLSLTLSLVFSRFGIDFTARYWHFLSLGSAPGLENPADRMRAGAEVITSRGIPTKSNATHMFRNNPNLDRT